MLGETINVMTLGGLALAVGILVDDATVTIENINYHLEQGKEIEPAIMDGARQIVVPATVSLLCICIVFVPMFGLGGVAGFLFRPLAEAVVFAMIGSYVLSRTLVPTLANYLLAAQAHHQDEYADHETQEPQPKPAGAVPAQLRASLRAGARRLPGLAGHGARAALAVRDRLSGGGAGSRSALAPFLGQNFFPAVDGGQIKLHIRAQIGTRIEDTAALCDHIEDAVRQVIPPAQLDTIVDNIGLPISGINMAYGNSGTIGVSDGDILISLKPDHAPTDGYVKTLRERLPRQFPGTTFAFLPADIVTQILNFGLPAPIDVQVIGTKIEANRAYAEKMLQAHPRGHRAWRIARIQQAFNDPDPRGEIQPHVRRGSGPQRAGLRRPAMQDTLAGSIQTAPTFWLNPKNGVSYPIVVQMPQYRSTRWTT